MKIKKKVTEIRREKDVTLKGPLMSRMSGRTAVWAVIWVQPTIFAPASGFSPWALFLKEIRADMSVDEQIKQQLMVPERTQRPGFVLGEIRRKDLFEFKNKRYLEGGCAVRGCKMGTNWTTTLATAVATHVLRLNNTCQALTPTYLSHGQCKQAERQTRTEKQQKKPHHCVLNCEEKIKWNIIMFQITPSLGHKPQIPGDLYFKINKRWRTMKEYI